MNWKFFSNGYKQTEAVLNLPREVLDSTISILGEYRGLRVESCSFWYGFQGDSSESVVTTIVVPPQSNRKGNFYITGDAMKLASQATRPLGLVNLSQVHTHPGKMVRHSWYDDENVNSRNALSIVLPYYGFVSQPWPNGIGVHEFQNDTWYTLTKRQVNKRIRIIDGKVNIIDLR